MKKPFEFGRWHAWQGNGAVMLSNEESKKLAEFHTTTDAINWLFTNGEREAARALNSHVKQAAH